MTAKTNATTNAHRPTLLELEHAAPFSTRHIGPREADQAAMLKELGYDSLDALEAAAVPQAILMREALDIPPAATEIEVLDELLRRDVRVERALVTEVTVP